MRLKDLKERFYVIHVPGKRTNLYNPNFGSGKTQNYRYLGSIDFDSKRGVATFNGVNYRNIDDLELAVIHWADSLPFHSDYYDESYRVGVKEEYCICDYLKQLGFERKNLYYGSGDTYVLTNGNAIDNKPFLDLTIKHTEDTTGGVIYQHIDTYKFISFNYSDLDDAIDKINSLVGPEVLMSMSSLMNIAGMVDMKYIKLDNFKHTTILKNLDTTTLDLKELVIQKLEETLNKLKAK